MRQGMPAWSSAEVPARLNRQGGSNSTSGKGASLRQRSEGRPIHCGRSAVTVCVSAGASVKASPRSSRPRRTPSITRAAVDTQVEPYLGMVCGEFRQRPGQPGLREILPQPQADGAGDRGAGDR